MLLDADESQLVLVDYQARLMPAIHEGEAVLRNARAPGPRWRNCWRCRPGARRRTRHELGQNPAELRALCRKTLAKMHFSAVADGPGRAAAPPARPQQGGNARSLPKHLQKAAPQPQDQRNTIVLAGCEAHVCLLQTALDLLEEEFEVWVVTDACSSRTERNRDAAFDRLAGAGAELVTTEMVAFEWLRTAEHPAFRDVQALVK